MCFEVRCGTTRIILDAGSGLRALGASLTAAGEALDAHLVLSHLHLDHVMGLSQFPQLWRGDARLVVHAPAGLIGADPANTVFSIISPPLFPALVADLPASIRLEARTPDQATFPAPGLSIRTFALTHQGESHGVAIEWEGRKLCYVTDHEHGDVAADARVTENVRGADLLIYDATFTDEELPSRRGWGHSTWQEGVRLQRRAGVKTLALAHHAPDRTDDDIDALAIAAKTSPAMFFARQGMVLTL